MLVASMLAAFFEVRFDSGGIFLQSFPVIALGFPVFTFAPLRFSDKRRPDKKAYHYQQDDAKESKNLHPSNI
jgi:hypothetical protein